jgi:hypothetical protein
MMSSLSPLTLEEQSEHLHLLELEQKNNAAKANRTASDTVVALVATLLRSSLVMVAEEG